MKIVNKTYKQLQYWDSYDNDNDVNANDDNDDDDNDNNDSSPLAEYFHLIRFDVSKNK